ncbi:DUF2933 domain-containing protein [Terrilactibacillus sp. BCM23-1]|uniref:DUF2933 domain-containing protein n=1 Tax=Terrilactibacillus tamarindi TaxID=2599694 RepID=A0A6N8CLH4_9BACI|nr:DUF2933 domain-containing protein [Terrilactibacillus tamarindi]MTT30621.1 DUF2933 domain-containing protein [Terrilactibacillus tamarindi]
MSCCGNHHHGNHNNKSGEHKRSHNWMMIVCLIIPVIVIGSFFLTNSFSGLSSLLPLALVLICPVMHLFLMPLMMKKSKGRHE